MRMLDLFCGRLGWSKAFLARGWECVGVDLVEPPEIPKGFKFVQMSVLDLNGLGNKWSLHVDCSECDGTGNFYRHDPDGDYLPCDQCAGSGVIPETAEFDFICASSPCEEFSVHGMKHFHPNPKYPENGIRLFNHTREICEASGVPYVMENVRAAQQFVGRAVHHCGPFYLWGTGVPAVVPQGIRKNYNTSGISAMRGEQYRNLSIEEKRAIRDRLNSPGRVRNDSYKLREQEASRSATIPPELANAVASYAERLLEMKVGSE